MANKTDMQRFYDNMDDYNFLAPNISLPGDFWLSPMRDAKYIPEHDALTLNAKIEEGQNLYVNFINQYYFNGLCTGAEVMKRDNRVEYHPIILSTQDEKGNRILKFDYTLTMENILYIFIGDSYKKDPVTDLDELEYSKKKLSEVRKRYWDLKLKGKRSKCYEAVKKIMDFPMCPATYNKLIDMVSGYIMTISNFQKNKANNPIIDLELFKKCFDIDKLYLMIAKFILVYSKEEYENSHTVSKIYPQLLFYIFNVLENTDFSYNPIIKWYDFDKDKTEDYSLDSLKRDVFSFEKSVYPSKYQGLKYDDISENNLLSNVLAGDFFGVNNEELKALQMSWTFIPSGKLPKDVTTEEEIIPNEVVETVESTETEEASKDKKFKNAALYHKIVLDKTNYKCKIVGKEKFAGYIGYIYDNGLVAFEKLYENNMKEFSKSSNATYIMKFVSFAKFTRLNKQEIIEYIKNTANPEVRRFYHSASWEQKLLRFLNGVSYNDEVNALIDAFIESQQEYKYIK